VRSATEKFLRANPKLGSAWPVLAKDSRGMNLAQHSIAMLIHRQHKVAGVDESDSPLEEPFAPVSRARAMLVSRKREIQ
jgi:hypothetical protein